MSYLPFSPDSRPLGKSGLSVSAIAWGMWRFGSSSVSEARMLIDAAFEAGITLFDTADIYGFGSGAGFGAAESLLGRVFAEAPGLRARMVLATKGGITPPVPYDSSAAYVAGAIDHSLKRLGVDHVDLWQVHRPDILTHPAELARALDDALRAGKIRAVGVSNYTPAQTRALAGFLSVPMASTQPEFSPLKLDILKDGTADLAMAEDIAILAWSPLGGGRIADPADDATRAVAALLDAKAAEHGVSRTAAAFSWIMAHPARPIPIVGSQNAERIRESADALKPRWTREQWYAVLQASMGEKLP